MNTSPVPTTVASLEEARMFMQANQTSIAVRSCGTTYVYRSHALLDQWLRTHFGRGGGSVVMYVPKDPVRPTCPPHILEKIRAGNLAT